MSIQRLFTQVDDHGSIDKGHQMNAARYYRALENAESHQIDELGTDEAPDAIIERLTEENEALRAYLGRVMAVLQQRAGESAPDLTPEPSSAESSPESTVTSLADRREERRSASRPWSNHPSVEQHDDSPDADIEQRLARTENALVDVLDVVSVLIREVDQWRSEN